MKPICTLMVEPGMLPVRKELLPTTEVFIQAISVGMTDVGEMRKMKIDDDIYIIYNGNAPLELEGNRSVNGNIICGTFYVVAIENNIPRSLTKQEVEKYTDRFMEIEIFDDWDVISQFVDEIYLNCKSQKYQYL